MDADVVEENEYRIDITEEIFRKRLIQGLEEARAIARGSSQLARRVRRAITSRPPELVPPRFYSTESARQIRERMVLPQRVFARVLHSSRETVKAWEQGEREPEGTFGLQTVAERQPQHFELDSDPAISPIILPVETLHAGILPGLPGSTSSVCTPEETSHCLIAQATDSQTSASPAHEPHGSGSRG
ncbi:MAG: hypothetical protein H0X65_18195 [Gemmatimonadetes bacterium]|nr:hypothetical protein [Gemmatimonadota bacterium]